MEVSVQDLALFLAAWPYYRSLYHGTITPAKKIRDEQDPTRLYQLIRSWMKNKEHELSYVSTAATVSAAGTVSIFSWHSIEDTIWYAKAIWYSSFILAIFALIASAQERTVLSDIYELCGEIGAVLGADEQRGMQTPTARQALESEVFDPVRRFLLLSSKSPPPPKDCEQAGRSQSERPVVRWRLSAKMLFLWQCPMMLVSYSWVFFVMALTLHIIQPFLLGHPWGHQSKIAVVYLAFALPCIGLFFASATLPHFINVENAKKEIQNAGTEAKRKQAASGQQSP